MHKLKLLFKDHAQLLFKSSADNHLRIQQCQKDKSGKIVCSLSFNSYSDLKRYQKKFRTVTVSLSSALAMVLIAAMVSPLIFNPSRSGAANYSWTQSSWDAAATPGSEIVKNGTENDQITYESKQEIDTSVLGEMKLASQNGSKTQTDSGTTETGFNLSGATFDQTEVSGESVKLTTSASLDTGSGADGTLNVTGTFNINTQTNGNGSRTCSDGILYNVASLSSEGAMIEPNFNASDWKSKLNWGSAAVNVIKFNTATGEAYIGGSSGKLAKYDPATQTATDLTPNAAPIFGGIYAVNTLGIDLARNTVYMGGASGRLGKYDLSGGVTTDFTSQVTTLFGTSPNVVAIAVDASSGEVYFSGSSGKFGKYNPDTGVFTNLTSNVSGIFTSSHNIKNLILDPDSNVIYLAGDSGRFGRYNIGSGAGVSLTSKISSFFASNPIYAAIKDPTSGEIYLGGTSGKFGKYNPATDTASSLINNINPFWGTNQVNSLALDPASGIIYLGSYNGLLAKYDLASNAVARNISSSISSFWGASVLKAMAYSANTGTVLMGGDTSRFGEVSKSFAFGGCLAADDKMLLINLQGSASSVTNVGNYEILEVGSYSSSTGSITFKSGKAKYYGDGGSNDLNIGMDASSQRVILQRIPQYSNVTVSGTGTLTANAWNGTNGGALVFFAQDTVDVQSGGQIDMSIKGYRDGDRYSSHNSSTDRQGESIKGLGTTTTAANIGGGGFNQGDCSEWVYVWGGASYGGNGTAPAPCGVTASIGTQYGSTFPNVMHLGSGSQGDGGGIIHMTASSVTVSGNINSKGELGGSGGSVYVLADSVDVGLAKLDASGGSADDGGDEGMEWWYWGAGGVGRIHLKANTINSGWTTVPTATTSTPELTYNTPGTFTSGVIDTGQKNFSWRDSTVNSTLNGQTMNVNVRSCTTDNCSAEDAGDKTWASCAANAVAITQASQILSPNGCMTAGDRYVQYQAALVSASPYSQSPALDDVALGFSYYPTTAQNLLSSIFDTTDKYTSIGKVSWSATNDDSATQGQVKFQLRSATSQAGLSLALWCGPTSCSADGNTFADSYYTDKQGLDDAINGLQGDHDNRFLQYAVFLSSFDGTQTPVLSDVTVDFSYNNTPTVAVTGSSQQSDGRVKIDYTVQETETAPGSGIYEQDTAYPSIFYQTDGITLFQDTTETGSEDIVLSNANNAPIPSSGKVLIGNELISYTSQSGNTTLSGVTRSQDFFAGDNYKTESSIHTAGSPVWFLATQVSGQINSTGISSIDGNAKTAYWDAKNEPNITLSGTKLENVKIKVAANDNDAFGNRVGSDEFDTAITVDYENPSLVNVTVLEDAGIYGLGATLTVQAEFSEDVTAVTDVKLTLETGDVDYDCTINSISGTTATCAYDIGQNQLTEALDVRAVTGTIKDAFNNQNGSLSITGGNISATKTIIIDTVPPQVSEVSPSANAYLKADGSITFTLDEQLASGTITLTAEAGGAEAEGTAHTYTLTEGQRADTGSQSVALSSFDPALVDGTKYALDFATEDLAGNPGDFTAITGIAFDTDAPSVTITSPDTDGFFNSITDASDFSYTIENDPFTERLESLELTFSDGTSDQSCNFSGNELDDGEHNGINVVGTCGAINLVSGTAYDISVTATDQAGNVFTANDQVTSATFDNVAPVLSHFYSTSSDSTVELPTGGGDVNITAVYDEVVSGDLEVKVGPMQADVRANLSSEGGSAEISGSFTIGPPKTGYDSTPDYIEVEEIISSTITDRAGNVLSQSSASVDSADNLANNGSTIVIDTSPPILNYFTIEEDGNTQESGAYKAGDEFTLVANYNKTIQAGGSVTVRLNTGSAAHDITLTNPSASRELTGTYTVVQDEDVADLKVESVSAQNVLDGKGTLLDVTGNIIDGSYAAVAEDPVTNLSGFSIDTKAPTLTSVKVTEGGSEIAEASRQNPEITLVASDEDPFGGLAGAKIYFSMDDGASWCGPVDYKQVVNATVELEEFLITNPVCGGDSTNDPELEKITAKIEDAAGNPSGTASDEFNYDSAEPVLESISVDTDNGLYGPGTQMKFTAVYDEDITSGNLIITLNNGAEITLDTVENGNILTTGSNPYVVGATGTGEDSSDLDLDDDTPIVSQSVFDTASPMVEQSGTSTQSLVSSIGTGKTIIVDTTSPTSSIVFDRSKGSDNGQLKITATDTNSSAGIAYETGSSSDELAACDLPGTFAQTYSGGGSGQDVNFTDDYSAYKKVCVRFKDAAGNESATATAVAPETPQDISYSDITNLDIEPPFKGIFILWPQPVQDGSGDFAEYDLKNCSTAKENADCSPTDDRANITDSAVNYHLHQDLSETNKYCYRLRFKDDEGNYSKYSDTTCQVPSEGTVLSDTVVSIDDVSIGAETNSGATVSFKTTDANPDHDSNPLPTVVNVEVFDNAELVHDPDNSKNKIGDYTDSASEYGISHIVKITDLPNSATQYYLKITATDSILSTETVSYIDDSSLTLTTTGALSSVTLISDDVTTNDKAVIEFRTDQSAKCFIEYKRPDDASNEGVTLEESEFKKSHTITITGLLFSDTLYSYDITCFDAGNTFAYLNDQDFQTSDKTLSQGDIDASSDTTAPEISAVSISELKGESAVITWNTANEKANSLVMYSLDGSDFNKIAGDSTVLTSSENYTTAHSVTISDLIPASKYVFTAISSDAAGNISQSVQSSFTTKEPSSLSSVKVLSKALNQATVTWETGTATTSVVEYGLTTSYGDKKESNTRTKDHEITISDLESGETYHFRVLGEDENGNLFASNDNTFEPKSPPKISDFKVDEITEHGAKITFQTNVPTDTLVEYTDSDDEDNSGVQGKTDFATRHELVLKNLASGTEFGLKLKVRDEDGNETEETFQKFKTATDENSPKIEQVRTDSALTQSDKVQAIISWKTDENSDTSIIYKEGKAGKENEIKVSDVMTTSHIAVITTFKPGTVYYFNVKSIDVAGNEAKSNDFALLTPKRKENIIQIIVNNFQDIFGWAQR